MVKRDYLLEEIESRWSGLPWWVKLKIVAMVTCCTWDSQLAY